MNKPKIPDKRKITLQEYYKTKHWKDYRKSLTDDDNCRCDICGRARWDFYKVGNRKGRRKPKVSLRMSIHHKHYRTLFKEKRHDVMVLCTLCHDTMHALHTLSNIDARYKQAYEQLCTSTGFRHEKRKELHG